MQLSCHKQRMTALLLLAHWRPRRPPPQRIARIEQRLLPAQVLAGTPLKPVTLADEMRRLHVAAVSVAVVHTGKIAWAKGFGATAPGGERVTEKTLFQAASISKSVAAMGVMHMVQSGMLELDKPVN